MFDKYPEVWRECNWNDERLFEVREDSFRIWSIRQRSEEAHKGVSYGDTEPETFPRRLLLDNSVIDKKVRRRDKEV